MNDEKQTNINSGMAKEIRVVQGKEPKHFKTIFQNSFVVFNGKQKETLNEKKETQWRLFEVRGSAQW